MIPKEAIEKAIEGGWENYPSDFGLNEHYTVMHDTACISALDPLFWQALGKALGWEENITVRLASHPIDQKTSTWAYHAHRFYDLILTGGDTKKFWEEILQDKK